MTEIKYTKNSTLNLGVGASGQDRIVSSYCLHNGYLIAVVQEEFAINAGGEYLYAFSFATNGALVFITKLQYAGYSIGSIISDDSYIYTSPKTSTSPTYRIMAYTFNGISFSYVAQSLNYGTSGHHLTLSNGHILSRIALPSRISAFSFDGAAFSEVTSYNIGVADFQISLNYIYVEVYPKIDVLTYNGIAFSYVGSFSPVNGGSSYIEISDVYDDNTILLRSLDFIPGNKSSIWSFNGASLDFESVLIDQTADGTGNISSDYALSTFDGDYVFPVGGTTDSIKFFNSSSPYEELGEILFEYRKYRQNSYFRDDVRLVINDGSYLLGGVFEVVNPGPNVDFTSDKRNGLIPLEVQFTDLTSGETVLSWTWNFGDGTPMSILQNPKHTYTTYGMYTVTLTVITASGTFTITKIYYIIALSYFGSTFYVDLEKTIDGHTGSLRDQMSFNDLQYFLNFLAGRTVTFTERIIFKCRGRTSNHLILNGLVGDGIGLNKNLLKFQSENPNNDPAIFSLDYDSEDNISSSSSGYQGEAEINSNDLNALFRFSSCEGVNIEITRLVFLDGFPIIHLDNNTVKSSAKIYNNLFSKSLFLLTEEGSSSSSSSSSAGSNTLDNSLVVVGNNWEALVTGNSVRSTIKKLIQ